MSQPLFHLDGCVALVTGAGRGMGRGVAETLARLGATVAVNDFYPERAEAAAAEIRAQGLKALAAPADVTDYAAVQAMVARVKDEAGVIDIYVSNAGVPTTGMGYARFLESTPEDWERFVKLNMYGLMNGCHAVLPGMLEKGWGRIVAITSESWRAGVPMGIAAYAASKAGVIGLARVLRLEWAPDGIGVSVICPPEILTPMVEQYATTMHPATRALKDVAGTLPIDEACREMMSQLDRGRFMVIPGRRARRAARMTRLLPEAVTTRMADRIVRRALAEPPPSNL